MGLNHFVRILQGGGTPDQVKAAMFGSPEYFQGRSGGTSAGFLTALYQDVLGRPVDPSGGVTWGLMLARGFSRELVARMVLASREADTIAVDGFYGRFLGRASDPGGLNTFVGALQRGVQERDVIAVIFASLEYDNRLG